ncbi:MAG: BON domain-containing protein, partial [Acinetobacter sp.]|nr:BON domain-containing protein [Acinetobacter sp.]
ESRDLDDVLQKVGNVTKIVTLIDNVDQPSGTVASSTAATPMVDTATTQPLVETPVAIDPDQADPATITPTNP